MVKIVQECRGLVSMMLLGAFLLALCHVGFGQVDEALQTTPCENCPSNPCKERGLTCCDCKFYYEGRQKYQYCQCCPKDYKCCNVAGQWTCCPIKSDCTDDGNCLSSQIEISPAVNSTTNCATCGPMLLTITIDDQINELYIDGVLQTSLINPSYWPKVDTLEIPADFEVIAVKGKDLYEVRTGILASVTDDYFLTNSQWKCTTNYYSGWMLPSFNDFTWSPAFEISGNPSPLSWGNQPLISSNAKWIWTRNFAHPNIDIQVYCRGTLSKKNGCNLNFGNCSNLCGSGTCCGCELCKFGPTKTCSCCPQGYECCGSLSTTSGSFSSNPTRYCCPKGTQCLANGQCAKKVVISYPPQQPTGYHGPCDLVISDPEPIDTVAKQSLP